MACTGDGLCNLHVYTCFYVMFAYFFCLLVVDLEERCVRYSLCVGIPYMYMCCYMICIYCVSMFFCAEVCCLHVCCCFMFSCVVVNVVYISIY